MTRSVLIVDDDDALSEVLAEALEQEGMTVWRSAHGLDALERLRAGLRPDVILLDLMMPMMDGWTFREVQARDPSLAAIPVVVLTAAHSPRSIDARRIMQKPFHLAELLRELNGPG